MLDGFRRLFLRRGAERSGAQAQNAARAGFGAGLTAGFAVFQAELVVDLNAVVFHTDGFGRAGLDAFAAVYAADLAYIHDGFQLVLRGAGDGYARPFGNELKHVSRAYLFAFAAAHAHLFVDDDGVVFDAQAFGEAYLHAVAEAEAGEAALVGTVMQGGCGRTGGNASVVEALGHLPCVLVAAAIGAQRFHFRGDFAGERAYGRGNLRPAHHAEIGRNGGIVDHGVGIAFTTGVAAAPAVGAGQGAGDFFHPGIFMDGEHTGSDGKHGGSGKAEPGKREYGRNDHSDVLMLAMEGKGPVPRREKRLDHALEGHEGKGHDSCHDERDGRARHGLGHAAGLQTFAYAGHEQKGEQKTRARGEGVEKRLHEIVPFSLYQKRDAENAAVRGDERQEYAQRGVEGRNGLFEEHFHELHQRGDDEDEDQRLEIFQTGGNEDVFLHQPCAQRGHDGDEDDGCAHAEGHALFLGAAEVGAVAEVLGQNDVVDEYGGNKNFKDAHPQSPCLSRPSFPVGRRERCGLVQSLLRPTEQARQPRSRLSSSEA